ncbi:ABC transporter ATP-binding protein [Enterovirga rhinocerotis]|uniref:Spermidine/putrescine import ATP-binding protein PotA n=1 Tax=Enterovirga rhinocerotis TaxID=1339210 RepID=A0A4R7C8A8_9HYPH|nr:ABC transporter ATP-binding protein [Enterovirga rhinocerotis]TDR92957.1 putative spermidine/putrescine transport system ATP-binding protein/spermidine/putrescine transport system ATP-binding protein [Enterovirga rhinocerotis]
MDVEIRGLTKAYGSTLAVQDLTCSIGKGEMIAFLGPSGCGKTTALRMIAGLVTPTAGEIEIGGRSISGLPVHRRNIGMLFQSYALFPHLTVAQNIAFGLQARKLPRDEIARRVREGMRLTRLEAFADRLPSGLSGGQQQRVALARALVIEPSVLLLDEPLGALDKNLREAMQMELRQIQQRLGITSIIVTHDQDEAMTLADRIVIMRAGRLEQVGAPAEVYGNPRSRFVAEFLGTANFLHGTVTANRDGAITLNVAGHAVSAAGTRAAPGAAATVFVRPEDVRLRPAGEPPAAEDRDWNRVPATVEKVTFRGPVTTIHLALPSGDTFVALRKNAKDRTVGPVAGDRIEACWPPSSAGLLEEEAPPSRSMN